MKEITETSPKRVIRHLKSCRSAKEENMNEKKATGCNKNGRCGD